jgi:hypothetical protein
VGRNGQAVALPRNPWRVKGGPRYLPVVSRSPGMFVEHCISPTFLFPHDVVMRDWLLPIIDLNTQVALAITGTGTGKTSGVSIAALTCCALYPDFNFLNAAPTRKQAELMLEEMTTWIIGAPFKEFASPRRSTDLRYKQDKNAQAPGISRRQGLLKFET